jgi:hypothetical protein
LGGTVSDADRGEGLLMIRRDNARIAERRAQEQLLREAQIARIAPPPPNAAVGTGQASPTRSWLDQSELAKAVAGQIAETVGYVPGVFRGGRDAIKDGLEAAEMGYALQHPLEALTTEGLARAGWRKLIPMTIGTVDTTEAVIHDPSILKRAAQDKLHQMNVDLNPSATPMADSFVDEMGRRERIGDNRGKLGFDVISNVAGGAEFRTVNGINKVRKALYGPALAANYGAASRARLAESYVEGMGSHYISRRWGKDHGIPDWIIDSPFNVSRPPGLTKGEMYMYHAMYDPKFEGAYLGKRLDRSDWRFKDFDAERFGPTERLIYGAPGALKGTVGGSVGGVYGLGRYMQDPGSGHD